MTRPAPKPAGSEVGAGQTTIGGVTILFDPFRTVLDAFAALYPDARCRLAWVSRENLDEPAHGHTIFPYDGGMPEVLVGTHLPLEGAVEVLAHELAHVAAGQGEADPHGPQWQCAFDAIHAEYCRRVEAAMDAAHG